MEISGDSIVNSRHSPRFVHGRQWTRVQREGRVTDFVAIGTIFRRQIPDGVPFAPWSLDRSFVDWYVAIACNPDEWIWHVWERWKIAKQLRWESWASECRSHRMQESITRRSQGVQFVRLQLKPFDESFGDTRFNIQFLATYWSHRLKHVHDLPSLLTFHLVSVLFCRSTPASVLWHSRVDRAFDEKLSHPFSLPSDDESCPHSSSTWRWPYDWLDPIVLWPDESILRTDRSMLNFVSQSYFSTSVVFEHCSRWRSPKDISTSQSSPCLILVSDRESSVVSVGRVWFVVERQTETSSSPLCSSFARLKRETKTSVTKEFFSLRFYSEEREEEEGQCLWYNMKSSEEEKNHTHEKDQDNPLE